MKKILLLATLILSFVIGHSQATYPINQSLGAPSTLVTSKGGLKADSSLILPVFSDTSKANISTYINKYPGTLIRVADSVYVRNNTATKWIRLNQILLPDTTNNISYQTRLVSGSAVWDTLLKYNVTRCTYFILGRFFTSLATTVTLAAADSSNPRIDVIYLDTLGHVGVLTGIPSPDPIKPVVNPISQIELTHININAQGTSPAGLKKQIVYNENLQVPTEWNTPASITQADYNYLANPYIGLKSINSTSSTLSSLGGVLQFNNSHNVNADTCTLLSMYLRQNGTVIGIIGRVETTGLVGELPSYYVQLFKGGIGVTNKIGIINGFYGYNRLLTLAYQNVVIPFTDFTFANSLDKTFDQIVIYNVASTKTTQQFDYITIQAGGNVPPVISNYWSLSGNDNSSVPTAKLGTTSNDQLSIVTNDIERINVATNGVISFPNIFTTSDTTEYKPLSIGSTGAVSKMTSWGNNSVYTVNPIMSTVSNDSNIIYFNADTAAAWRSGGGTFTSPNLQQVTDSGNTTTNSIEVDFLQTNGDVLAGKLGAGGGVVIDDGGGFAGRIEATNLITTPTLQLPNASGTLAMSVNGNIADSAGNITISAGSGTVTSISQGYGIINSPTNPITTTGTITVDTATLSTKYLRLTDTTFANLQSVLNKGNTATGKSMRLYSSAISGANLFMNANYPNIYPYKDVFHYALLSADNTISTSRPQLYIQGGTGNDSTQVYVLSDSIAFDKFGTIGNNGAGLRYNNKNLFSLRADSIALNQKNTSSDTTTYKPIGINSSGKIAKMSSWGSGEGSGTVYVDSIYRTIGKDSIFYKKNGNTYAIKDSVGTNPAPLGYYGAFSDTLTQTAAAINTGYAMKFALNDITPNGISMVANGGGNKTRITIANTGIYNLQWSAQFTSLDNAENDVSVWLRKNGTDVVGSRGLISVPKKIGLISGHALPSWNFVLNVVAGEYYEFVWSTSNINVSIDALPLTAYAPSTASTILTVTQQSGIMAGTGITAINSLTGAAQTMVTGTDSSDFKIASTGTSHTFNLPTASATKRGALSSTDWSTFNGKIGASDTSVFQRKSISSYSVMANNTNAAANTTALPFHSAPDAAYTGVIGFTTGSTNPSGASILRYTWNQIGNLVTFRFDFTYATASGSLTSIFWEVPSDMPQPTFNSTFALQPQPYVFNGGTALQYTTAYTARACTLTRNTGNTAWQFTMTFTNLSVRYFTMYGSYFAN